MSMKHTSSLLAGLAALFLTSGSAAAQAGMAAPTAMGAAALRAARSGSEGWVVVTLVSRTRGDRWRARVLDLVAGTEYRRTSTTFELDVPDPTPVVMGTLDDLRAGAIVDARVIAGSLDRPLQARKIVVLTSVVRVHD